MRHFFLENSFTQYIFAGISYAEQENHYFHPKESTSFVAPIYMGILKVRPYDTDK